MIWDTPQDITPRSIPVRRACALVVAVGVALSLASCSIPWLSKSPAVRFRGDAADPIGDTASIGDPRVARPADLVYAGIQVTDASLRLTVRFAPGSLDPTTTGVSFAFDTDLDPQTGGRDLGIGADYVVSLHAGPRRGATIARAVIDADCSPPGIPCRYEPFERAELVLSTDAMEAVFRRSAFAKFDGRLDFRVVAYASLDGGRLTATSDHLPNLPARFVSVR
jgi:hypothetical protein